MKVIKWLIFLNPSLPPNMVVIPVSWHCSSKITFLSSLEYGITVVPYLSATQIKKIETIYRLGISTVLEVMKSNPNTALYIESHLQILKLGGSYYSPNFFHQQTHSHLFI